MIQVPHDVRRCRSAHAGNRAPEREVGTDFKITNDPRITRVGKWLRKTSIDELPQLINVLLGDMRHCFWTKATLGSRCAADGSGVAERRFSVKPGLDMSVASVWPQQSFLEQWMELDLEYIDRWSLGLDGIILLRTIPAILLARGAS